jgi:hypothetical protein
MFINSMNRIQKALKFNARTEETKTIAKFGFLSGVAKN